MNVIKYFFKNLRANILVFLMYITVFLVFLFFSTSGNAKSQANVFEATKAKIGLIKNSDDEVANAIESYLNDYAGEKEQVDILPDDIDMAREWIYMGNYDAIVRIPKDALALFEDDQPTIEVLYNTMGYEGHLVDNRLKVFLMMYKAREKDGQYDLEKTKQILKEQAAVEFVDVEQTPMEETNRIWVQTFFNTTGYVLMAVYISLVGVCMSSFSDVKTKLRIAISSKDQTKLQMEIYTAQFLLGTMITALFIGVCYLFKGSALIHQDMGKFILNLIVYSMVVIALTFMLNNITNNKHAKNALATALSLGLAFISGVIIPQSMMGEKVLAVAKFFPLYYYVQINEMNMPGRAFFIRNLGMQLLFGVLYFMLGLYFANKRRLVR